MMSISNDMMRIIVRNGSNLIIEDSVNNDLLRELVSIAKETGATITIRDDLPYELIKELTSVGGNQVSVVTKQR
jgi:hypothetical protein